MCHPDNSITWTTLNLSHPFNIFSYKVLIDLCAGLTPEMKPLDWNTRMKIAAGAARGLEYLHNKADPPVIYRDLKAGNILLGKGFHPKLSDFGLAKFGPTGDKSHVSTRVMGTHGYCAPEYATTGKLTAKSDIFSFGVVLLELITGRPAMDDSQGHERMLVDWVTLFFCMHYIFMLKVPNSVNQTSITKDQ